MGKKKVLIEWDGGRIVESTADRVRVVRDGGADVEYPGLPEALAAVAHEETDEVSFHLDMSDVMFAAEEAGLDALFPTAEDGLERWEDWLIPERLRPDRGYPESYLDRTHRVGEHGCRVEVYDWEGLKFICAIAPEASDVTWRIVGWLNDADAEAEAEITLADLLLDMDLDFDEDLDLDNEPISDQDNLPETAVLWRTVSSYYTWAETLIGELEIHREPTSDGYRYLVTRVGEQTVIGRYESEDALRAALDTDPRRSTCLDEVD
jgi:hypothetical protein